MNVNGRLVAFVGLLVVIGTAGPAVGNQTVGGHEYRQDSTDDSNPVEQNITSYAGVEYNIELDLADLELGLEVSNPTERTENGGYSLLVDKHGQRTVNRNITPGETIEEEINLSSYINPTRDKHYVDLSILGNGWNYTFEQKFDMTSPGRIPTPQISNVTIANGTINGNASTVAYVTVNNPTNQLYSMKLMVHSIETGGGWYPASVRRGRSRTIKAVLFEDLGNETAGEARLYVNGPSNTSGALDQVEFVGQAGNGTEVYNRSYRPVTPPWKDDPYQYDNDSVRPDTDDDAPIPLDEVGDRPGITAVAGLGVLAGLAVLYRRRR